MSNLVELGQRRTAYALGRRIGAGKFRVLAFELLQFAKQPIVLGVANQRRVEHIVLVVVPLDFCAQFARLRLNWLRDRH